MSFQTSALILAWIAIAVLSFSLAGILRQLALLRGGRPSDISIGPPLGSRVSIGNGVPVSFSKTAVLLFLDTTCEGCEQILPRLSEISVLEPELDFVALYKEEPMKIKNPTFEILEHQSPAFEELHIPVTPFGVTVGTTGTVLDSAPLGSISRLDQFVSRAKERSSKQ